MSDSQQPTRTGACLCGNIHFEVTGDPTFCALCHCSNCRKTSGSSFQANLFFKQSQVNVVDEKKFLRIFVDDHTESGRILHRHFCVNCGSSMFNTTPFAPDMITVASGAVEDTTGWDIKREFFCRSRKEWLPEIPGATTYTENGAFEK